MAHLSGDESLISALNNGEDIHTFTAKNIFNIDNDDMVLPEMRRIAKIVNQKIKKVTIGQRASFFCDICQN